MAADPANAELMTFASPKTGAPVWRCYHVPKTAGDLASRRLMSARWAEETFGLMGRTPDHVAGFLAGYAAKPSVFAEASKQFAENVVRYHEHARDNSLYLSYAIVPPQIDRSKPAHKQSDPTLHAGVVKERDDGIVLKGCQQLATGAAFSDAVYISCIHPLTPGDEAYAFAGRRAGKRAGAQDLCAPSIRHDGDECVRLSALDAVRRDRRAAGAR